MIGKLDPEERIFDDDFYSKRKATAVMKSISTNLKDAISKLGWECYDDVVVDIAGVSVSAVDDEEMNVKYNKTSFIVIKNRNRSPYTPSKAPEDSNES